MEQLPRVDLSVTPLSRLYCRHGSLDERLAFNARVLAFMERWLTKLEVLMLLGVPFMGAMFFVRDPALQAATAITAFSAAVPLLVLCYATLACDMAALVTRTFEFWFLTAANAVNTLVLFSMFRDVRVLGVISGTCLLQLTLFTDANLRSRLVELRFLVFGAPGIFVVIVTCLFRITAGLHATTFDIWGASVSDVDLLINGNFIIAFFTTRKTHRNRHLLSPKHAGERHIVQCQMYFPTCRLVALDTQTVSRLRARTAHENDAFTRRKSRMLGTTIEYQQTLHMVSAARTDAFDVDDLVLRRTARCRLERTEKRLVQWSLNGLVIVGVASSTIAHATSMLQLDTSSSASQQLAIKTTGFVATLIVTTWYVFHCQRDLLRMLVGQVDTWFAVVHFTMVAVCAADIVSWRHDAIPVFSAWIWSLWVVLLDAVPPAARRSLGFQRWLLLEVDVLLMLSHVWLMYALFLSSTQAAEQREPLLRNRVLVDFSVGGYQLRFEMFSFITSKIFTSFMWMGRFLWRESVRPCDAFKLIKHRAIPHPVALNPP